MAKLSRMCYGELTPYALQKNDGCRNMMMMMKKKM